MFFENKASEEDEKSIQDQLEDLLNNKVVYNETTKANDTVKGFRNVEDNKAYVDANSDLKFEDRYLYKSALPEAIADTIFSLNVGDVLVPLEVTMFLKRNQTVISILTCV